MPPSSDVGVLVGLTRLDEPDLDVLLAAQIDERTRLYLGNTPTRWNATGFSFNAYRDEEAGSSPVCRYYFHLNSAILIFSDGAKQNAHQPVSSIRASYWKSLDLNMDMPSNGVCPVNTIPVYHVFSNRIDANHRYTTDRAVRDAMVTKGWLAEGDGADRVVMCAPT